MSLIGRGVLIPPPLDHFVCQSVLNLQPTHGVTTTLRFLFPELGTYTTVRMLAKVTEEQLLTVTSGYECL